GVHRKELCRMPVSESRRVCAATAGHGGQSRMEQHCWSDLLGSRYGVIEEFPDSRKADDPDSRGRVQCHEQLHPPDYADGQSDIGCGPGIRERQQQPVRSDPVRATDQENAVCVEVRVLAAKRREESAYECSRTDYYRRCLRISVLPL